METPTILSETSIGSENTCRNSGAVMTVHYVAKTAPFVMDLLFPFSLVGYKFEISLYYDGEDEKNLKPVPSVCGPPMESKIFLNSSLNRATIECRIQVLTSQHKDSLFRVRVLVFLPNDSSFSLEIYSSPIFMVSKQGQALKILHKKEKPAPSVCNPPKEPLSTSSTSDSVLEILKRLEKRQLEQQKQLDSISLSSNLVLPVTIPDPEDRDFHLAFERFLSAFKRIPTYEQPFKLRKLSSSKEFVDICSMVTRLNSSFTQNAEKWDDFYTEIFSDASQI